MKEGLVGNLYEIAIPFNRRFIVKTDGTKIHEQLFYDWQFNCDVEKPYLNVKPGTNPKHIPVTCWSEIKNNEHVPYVPNKAIVEMINRGGRTYLVTSNKQGEKV